GGCGPGSSGSEGGSGSEGDSDGSESADATTSATSTSGAESSGSTSADSTGDGDGDGDVECVSDDDCQLQDDCCGCAGHPQSYDIPPCDNDCFAPLCAPLGIESAACVAGVCTVAKRGCDAWQVQCDV